MKKDSNYFNMIHRKKSLKKLFFMGGEIKVNKVNKVNFWFIEI